MHWPYNRLDAGRKTDPPQNHDGERDPDGTYPYHVQPRDGSRRHETDRRPHGRRRRHLHASRTGHLSGNLYALEGEKIQRLINLHEWSSGRRQIPVDHRGRRHKQSSVLF